MKLDPFYPIVDSAAWIERLAPSGIKLVQLRIKHLQAVELRAEIDLATAFCAVHAIMLVVNDHWQMAIDAGAPFVHLGQGDLDNADLVALRARGIKFGISTHDETELERAMGTNPDYVALGPIWPTTLKIMPFAAQGTAKLNDWKRAIGARPLVAIGGITLERSASCYQAGADIVSVVSDVTGAKDPVARAAAWMSATRVALQAQS